MSDSEKAALASARAHMMYDANRKSTGVAYLLWFIVGWFGVHRFYLGQSGTGAAQLILWILGWITFFIAWIPLGIWLFVDLFLIPGMARDHNMKLADRFVF